MIAFSPQFKATPSAAKSENSQPAPAESFQASQDCLPCKAPVEKARRTPADQTGLSSALDELRQFKNRTYYDETADLAAKTAYYSDIDFQASPEELFKQLSNKTISEHSEVKDYRPSKYLYPWIDLQPDGELKSLYSGHTMAADVAIIEDWQLGQMERQAQSALAFTQAALSPEAAATSFALQEQTAALNCEHVVPQSWFGKSQPARGDLHHLFACESRCNSRRSNLPYDELKQGRQDWRDDCGIISGGRFEPIGGKGTAARATLYFLLRYPDVVDRYDSEDIKTLLDWHEQFPVSLYELHRNAAIEEVQGNRNPLIDFPELAHKIDFSSGLK